MKVKHYLTAKDTDNRLTLQSEVKATKGVNSEQTAVRVDTSCVYQTIEGFGAAFTEAAAVTFYKMSKDIQDEIIESYFSDSNGNAYNLCRTHINSCDFALGNYAYTEVDGDKELKHFNIEHDHQALIPLIKTAQAKASVPMKMLASPWSPPAWMKTTGKMNEGGKLKDDCRQAWANYYCRYIREYEKIGLDTWAITVQNEPAATQKWDSCVYTSEEERDFVRDYLGPALHREGLENIKVVIWDHNRDLVYERGRTVLSDPEAAKYVWGTGFHWYCGDNFNNLAALHDAFPDKKLLFTEGCQEAGPHFGSWDLMRRYGHSIINDLNNWTVGWIDWNMILDETGGPNHVNNLCSAPIMADTVNNKLIYQPSYYALGHFSRFIKPGAQRILCATTKDELEATAFLNPDGTIVIVLMNWSDRAIDFTLKQDDNAVEVKSPAYSMSTFVIEPTAKV